MDLYADDNYLGEDNENVEELLLKLQAKTNRVTDWLQRSGLKVNLDKTELVLFHSNKSKTGKMLVQGKEITSQTNIKVLGIIFDENMTWSHHINAAIKKAKGSILD